MACHPPLLRPPLFAYTLFLSVYTLGDRMASRRRNSHQNQRLGSAIPTRSLSEMLSSPTRLRPIHVRRGNLAEVSDRRLYHPLQAHRPARYFTGATHRLKTPAYSRRESPGPQTFSPSPVVAFENPKKLDVCVRRAQRREVLFATNKRGAGSKAKTRRRNENSGVSCK